MKRKDILLLLVPSFIFVMLWTVFNIYHSYINSTISEVLNIQISPISANFDTNTINDLKQRQNVSPLFEVNSSSIADRSESSGSAELNNPPSEEFTSLESSSGGSLSQ
jgi:hypothetical protein